MNLPENYYHSFLGNGLDAVLVGYTGSMVSDKIAVDRCNWYKSDRYYPEIKLVQVSGRWPMGKPLEHLPGSGWYEVAPLGRTWYQVRPAGSQPDTLGVESPWLAVQNVHQVFVPQEGILYSAVDYGAVRVKVQTFLHARRSLLVERYEFDRPVELRAWMGPGVWVEEGWDTNPFLSVTMESGAPQGSYDLGESHGILALRLQPAPTGSGAMGDDRWVSATGTTFLKLFSIVDDRQGALEKHQGQLDYRLIDEALALGYDALRQEQVDFWREYFSASRLTIPDGQFQAFYDFSMYMFKAIQNPVSGGLPVNNLRRTWSSHVFWDSYFIQRALLEAGHTDEALEACRFFQRTTEAARRHARNEFGVEGLKWDWEITHEGRKAYGALAHMKDQVHNNASYANMIWQYYQFTRDLEMLRDFYPILEGMARYFLADVVEEPPGGGYGTRPVVGVSENPIRVRNEGITLAGTIIILRRTAEAADLLGIQPEIAQRCLEVSAGLENTLGRLYNGRYFVANENSQSINMSSLAPFYPMQVFDFNDERALSTAREYLGYYKGRMVGHGGNQRGFPWSAGVLATVFARQGQGDTAWNIIQGTRPAICSFGGMTEVMEENQWNMQYFGTAQAAVCTAIHNLLLQGTEATVAIFPALPSGWAFCAFEGLLSSGFRVSARYDQKSKRVEGSVQNIAPVHQSRHLTVFGQPFEEINLAPGEQHGFNRQD